MSKEKRSTEEPADVEEVVTAAEESAKESSAEASSETSSEANKLEEMQKLLDASNSKYLYLAAEYDNYRKRSQKEKESIYQDAKVATLKSILDVYDNLERGLNQFEEGDPHRQGMELIVRQFLDALEKQGVKEIAALNQPFDPEKHEAVMHIEDSSLGENVVVEVFQKGFELDEKILRCPKVKVAN